MSMWNTSDDNTLQANKSNKSNIFYLNSQHATIFEKNKITPCYINEIIILSCSAHLNKNVEQYIVNKAVWTVIRCMFAVITVISKLSLSPNSIYIVKTKRINDDKYNEGRRVKKFLAVAHQAIM